MRRLSLILLVALLALPAAAIAARADKGDGSFELKAGNGTFIMTGRGVLLAQMDKGVLRVTDPTPFDAQQPAVSGAEHVRATDDPNTMIYQGSNIHVRITGGKYRLHFRGTGVDLTAVGVGTADLTGSALSFDPGSWSADGSKWLDVPYVDRIVPFGTSTTPGP
jgi:hypothetical protein